MHKLLMFLKINIDMQLQIKEVAVIYLRRIYIIFRLNIKKILMKI